ncbi:MAG: cytochrome c oxidase assembly protein [Thermoleophilaceae bacterium]
MSPPRNPEVVWTLSPGVLSALAVYLTVYLVRWLRVRRDIGARAAGGWRLVSFAGGIGCLAIALVSPIDRLGEQLLVFHVAQHIFLMDLAAILLLGGLTRAILRPLSVHLVRLERAAGPLGHPAFAVLLYGGVLWLWHVPALYQLGLENPTLHPLQHVSFALAALAFWWHVLSPIRSRRRLAGMAVVFYVGAAKLFAGGLGSVLSWSPVFLYDFYARQPGYLGLDPTEDQALAGALILAEGSVVLTVAAVALFVRMLAESEREQQRAERFGPG